VSSSAKPRIAIIGAGVGGLAAALALRAEGLDVDLYEQAGELSEVGAGVSLGANGMRLLDRLGVGPAARRVAAQPHRIQFHHWRTGGIFYEHPMADWYTERYGAPFLGLHRADLQQVLLDSLLDRYGIAPELKRQCVQLRESGDGVKLHFADGTTTAAGVVIGADGLRSSVRRHVAGPDEAVFSAMSCYRGLVPIERVPGGDRLGLTFFLGPGRHLVAYPVRRGTLINFIAYLPDPVWTLESWSAKGDPAEAVSAFAGWTDLVTTLLGGAEETGRWALYDREPLRRWSTDRITLLGDAAHPMLPHAGQGSNQAIEDAVVLAYFLGRPELTVPEALRRYESVRRPRTRLLQMGSRGNAACFQLPDGPQAQHRNAGLVRLPDNIAWIHSYDPDEDLHPPNLP
jgi:salicylate hydroxylase